VGPGRTGLGVFARLEGRRSAIACGEIVVDPACCSEYSSRHGLPGPAVEGRTCNDDDNKTYGCGRVDAGRMAGASGSNGSRGFSSPVGGPPDGTDERVYASGGPGRGLQGGAARRMGWQGRPKAAPPRGARLRRRTPPPVWRRRRSRRSRSRSQTGCFEWINPSAVAQQNAQQRHSVWLRSRFGCASVTVISLYLTSITHFYTRTYKRRCRTENLWVCRSGLPPPIAASLELTIGCGCALCFAIPANEGCTTGAQQNATHTVLACMRAGRSNSRSVSRKAQASGLNVQELGAKLYGLHGVGTLRFPVPSFDHGQDTGPYDGPERFRQAGPSVHNVGQLG
jgi:hypothetical protein